MQDDAVWLPTPPTAKEEAGFLAADETHHRAFESQWIGSERSPWNDAYLSVV
jgi:hypothetical protein